MYIGAGFVVGKVLIVEVGYNPVYESSNRGEWFKIYNQSAEQKDLSGWTVQDSGAGYGVYQFSSGVFINPYQSIVVANLSTGPLNVPEEDRRPGFLEEYGQAPDLEMAGDQCKENGNQNHCLQLHNSQSDSLILKSNYGVIEDSVQWYVGASFPQSENGESICRITYGSSFLDTDADSDWLSNCTPTPFSIPFTPPVISLSSQSQKQREEDITLESQKVISVEKKPSSGGSNPLVVQRLREADTLFGDVSSYAQVSSLADQREEGSLGKDKYAQPLESTKEFRYKKQENFYRSEKQLNKTTDLLSSFRKYVPGLLKRSGLEKNLLTQ